MTVKERGIRRPIHRGDDAFPLVVRLKGLKEFRPDSPPHEFGVGREKKNLSGRDRSDRRNDF